MWWTGSRTLGIEGIYPLFHSPTRSPIYLSSHHPSIYPSTHLSIHMSVYPFIHSFTQFSEWLPSLLLLADIVMYLDLVSVLRSSQSSYFLPLALQGEFPTTSDKEPLDILFLLHQTSFIYLSMCNLSYPSGTNSVVTSSLKFFLISYNHMSSLLSLSSSMITLDEVVNCSLLEEQYLIDLYTPQCLW